MREDLLTGRGESFHEQVFYDAYIYIIKQAIRIYIYVAYSRPNGWTGWAEIFCRHLWVAGDCYRQKI